MLKQELTLDEARQELGQYVGKLERWEALPKGEQFISSYRMNLISQPFVEKTKGLITGPEMTQEEMRWQGVIYQLVRFRRTFEIFWKAKDKEEIDFTRRNTLRELRKLLKVYDNFMAGE